MHMKIYFQLFFAFNGALNIHSEYQENTELVTHVQDYYYDKMQNPAKGKMNEYMIEPSATSNSNLKICD